MSAPVSEKQQRLASLEKRILEQCDSVTSVATGIFLISIFLTILRPDPTLVICMFGFYGAHVRSYGAIRSFWFFTLITILVDALWLLVYSPLRPIAFDTLKQMSRKDQLSVTLSVLNAVYKLQAVWTALSLSKSFSEREDLIKEIETAEVQAEEGSARTAGEGGAPAGTATTSSGEPQDSRSLAAQVAK